MESRTTASRPRRWSRTGRRRRLDLSHPNDVAVRILEKRSANTTVERGHALNLDPVGPQIVDLSLDVLHLEGGHGAVDGPHWPFEDRQSGSVAAAVAHRLGDLNFHLEAELFLIEATSPLKLVHRQGRGHSCARQRLAVA